MHNFSSPKDPRAGAVSIAAAPDPNESERDRLELKARSEARRRASTGAMAHAWFAQEGTEAAVAEVFDRPVKVAPDADAGEMNKLHGERYGVDWEYPEKSHPATPDKPTFKPLVDIPPLLAKHKEPDLQCIFTLSDDRGHFDLVHVTSMKEEHKAELAILENAARCGGDKRKFHAVVMTLQGLQEELLRARLGDLKHVLLRLEKLVSTKSDRVKL